MSTKIYSGLRFRRGVDAAKAKAALDRARNRIQPNVEKAFMETVVRLLVFRADVQMVGLEAPGKGVAIQFFDDMQALCKTGDYDLRVELFLDPAGRYVYAIPYGSRAMNRLLMENLPEAESYGYWNNTDAPDDVSAREWNRRGVVWDRVLGDTGIPSRNGLLFEMISAERDLCNFMAEALIPHIPPIEERAARLAVAVYLDETHGRSNFRERAYAEAKKSAYQALKAEEGERTRLFELRDAFLAWLDPLAETGMLSKIDKIMEEGFDMEHRIRSVESMNEEEVRADLEALRKRQAELNATGGPQSQAGAMARAGISRRIEALNARLETLKGADEKTR
jgi:hypothetical protein